MWVIPVIVASAMTGGATLAADNAARERGREVFEHWCAPCHAAGPKHPGTQALAALYNGSKPDALEQRTDLTPEFVTQFVRNGVSIMAPFRKTEITDADLAALGAYLSRR